MFINKSVLKAIIGAANNASKDATRYNLCGVMAKTYESTFEVVATNGHSMSVSTFDMDRWACSEGEERKSFWVSTDLIKPINAAMKTVKFLNDFEIKDGHLIIGAQQFKLDYDMAANYPDYRQVVPAREGYDYAVSFNVDYLESLLGVLKNGGKNGHIQMRFKNNKVPFIVECCGTSEIESGEHIGIIMPVRNDNKWPERATNSVEAEA